MGKYTHLLSKETMRVMSGEGTINNTEVTIIKTKTPREFNLVDIVDKANTEYLTDEEQEYFDEQLENGNIVEVDDEYFTLEFLKASCDHTQCRDCDEWLNKDDAYYIENEGEYVCERCLDYGYYYYCEDCGNHYTEDAMTEILNWRGEILCCVCDDCRDEHYYRCDHCENWYRDSGVYTDDWDNQICESCYDDCYYRCEDCDRLIYTDDAYYSDEDDAWYCESCFEEKDARAIHNYSYKPEPTFFGESVEMHYGIELEVDGGRDRGECAREVADSFREVYCKSDGSLDCGFEIVSHPCTLDYHLNELGWEDIMQTCKDYGFKSHDVGSCGLHLHIEKAKMKEDTPEKLVVLVDAIWNDLVKFSRRTDMQLERWAKKPELKEIPLDANKDITKLDKSTVLKEKAKKIKNKGRYQAVNLLNYATVEIRIFRGTLKWTSFAATLQFVDNMVKFCENHTFEELEQATFKDVANVNLTDELKQYCGERGLAI